MVMLVLVAAEHWWRGCGGEWETHAAMGRSLWARRSCQYSTDAVHRKS